jgi:predicted MFS family arabinose efflux permease
MGILTGFAVAVFMSAAGLPLARWLDRGTRKNILAGACVLWSFATMLCGAVTSFVQLLLLRIVVVVGDASSSPGGISMVSDLFPQNRRATAVGTLNAGAAVGFVFATAVGGWVADHYGWRAAFVALGFPGLIVAALMFFTVSEPKRGGFDGSTIGVRAPALGEVLRHLLAIRSFYVLVIGGSCALAAAVTLNTWAAAFLIRAHSLSTATTGFLLGPVGLVALAGGNIGAGLIADALGKRHVGWYFGVPILSLAVGLPALVGFLYVNSVTLSVVLLLPAMMGMAGASSVLISSTLLIAKPSTEAVTAALFFLLTFLVGLGVGPTLAGAAADWLKPSYGETSIREGLLIVSGTAAVLGIVVLLIGRRWLQHDRAR